MRSPQSYISCCAILLALIACADRDGAGGGGATGGTLVIALGGNAAPLLPLKTADVLSRNVADQVYDRLADIGPELNSFGDRGFTPRLARSWTWSPDSQSIAFSLDPRARWHDGQPVRAADVKFTFDLIKDPKSATSLTASMTSIDSMTVRDSLTAVAWFSRRSPEQFYDAVYHMHVMPAHVLKDVTADKLETVDVNTKLIGSGRFRLARFEPGTRVELIADTANYRGRAKLDRVVWTFAPDAGATITQLFAGQADMVEIIPPEVAARADTSTTVKSLRYPGLTYAYMGMNNRDPRRPGAPHPIFGDRRVRRAISMGLDREAMVRNVFDTAGRVAIGPYPRALADTSAKPLPFDRARAAAELDSAGWRMGPDSVRSKGGRPLAFSLLVPTSSSPRMRYAVLIQEQLKPLGVRVNVESMDFQAYADRMNRRNFDALLNLWQPDPTIGGVREVWASENIRTGGQNIVSYSNRTFDALLDSAAMTFDAERSRQYKRRAYEIILDDAPAAFLYDGLNIAGMHRRLRPVDIRPTAWWYGLADWTIPENERIDRDRIGLRPAQP